MGLAGPNAIGAFPVVLLYTVWVPIVDGLGFAAVTAIVAVLLVRRRLTEYRDQMLLGEPEQKVRAAQACEFLGCLGREAVPELIQATVDSDSDLRYRAVRALGIVKPREAEAVDAIRRCLTDRDGRVRIAAGCALGRLKIEESGIVLPSILAALQSDDDDLREIGVRAAITLRFDAAPAVEPIAALADYWKFSGVAFEALRSIGPAARPALTRLQHHPKQSIRRSATIALSQISPDAGPTGQPQRIRGVLRPAVPRDA
jgi:HEAT repeat protein